MPTPNPTPSLAVPGQEDSHLGYENNSHEAGVIRRQLDSKQSLRSRSIVRRRKSQFPGPRDPKDSPPLAREQMNSISEEQDAAVVAPSQALLEESNKDEQQPQQQQQQQPLPSESMDSKLNDQSNETQSTGLVENGKQIVGHAKN